MADHDYDDDNIDDRDRDDVYEDDEQDLEEDEEVHVPPDMFDNEFFGEQPVTLNKDTSNVVVVDNIPIVNEAKYSKLISVVVKIFEEFGKIKDFWLPFEGEPKKTVGYMFIEYERGVDAEVAVRDGDKKRLDKLHTLRVNLLDDYDQLKNVPDTFQAKMEDYKGAQDLQSWLLDGDARDEYVVRFDQETEIYWNDPRKLNQEGRVAVNLGEAHKQNGKHWTDLITRWSPMGTYLATFHLPGLLLWGGDDFTRQARFSHHSVQFIEFSPRENYIITVNGHEPKTPHDPENIIVWEIKTGRKLRGFDGGISASVGHMFKWSHDDQFIARVSKDKHGQDAISIYQVPDMNLLGKKSIKVPRVQEILWSPTDNLLAYWVPEYENSPAKVSIASIPSRDIIREKHLYSVVDVKMHWQSNGDYLCVKITRQKTKKTLTTNFEIFRLKVKDVPVEVLEMDDQIIAFAWEPNGHRFAIIHTPPNTAKTNVSFYRLQAKKLTLIATLEDRSANCLFWSPVGNQIIIAGLDLKTHADDRNSKKDGILEFVDVGTKTVTSMCTREHYLCTDVEWDPSGRYVVSSVTQQLFSSGQWKYAAESGYKVWTFDGKGNGIWTLSSALKLDKCYQIMWRPRPPCVLPPSKQQAILKSLKDTYWEKYAQEDEQIRFENLGEAERIKLRIEQSWKKYREQKDKERADEAPARLDLRGGYPSDNEDDYEDVEEVMETELSETVEYLD